MLGNQQIAYEQFTSKALDTNEYIAPDVILPAQQLPRANPATMPSTQSNYHQQMMDVQSALQNQQLLNDENIALLNSERAVLPPQQQQPQPQQQHQHQQQHQQVSQNLGSIQAEVQAQNQNQANGLEQFTGAALSLSQPSQQQPLTLTLALAKSNQFTFNKNLHYPPDVPFGLNSYPITNPPIFDSTYMLPYTNDGIPRRRRVSISNGQIGQIMNHEAFFDDFDSSLDDGFSRFNDYEMTRPGTSTGLVDNATIMQQQQKQQQQQQQQRAQAQAQAQIQNLQLQQQTSNELSNQVQVKMELPQHSPRQYSNQSIAKDQQNQSPQGQDQSLDQTQRQVQSQLPSQLLVRQVPTPPSSVTVAGVPPPNHQLIYNDEVIYNPNNGPITGTAAWKKERLLERNRIAASKCRQRKKNAQLQLQESVNRMERDLAVKNQKIQELENVVQRYKMNVRQYLEEGKVNEELLLNLINL